MNKTATSYKSPANGKTTLKDPAPEPPPTFSNTALSIIGILAAIAITFGILWGLNFFGPDYKRQVNGLNTQVDTLNSEIQTLRGANAALREQLGLPLEVGFEVQIAAFQHFDISASSEKLVRMAEVKNDGLNKYVLGRFSQFSDAEAFLKDLESMGLYDAFIAGLVNGERATVAEAKEAAKSYYGDN